VGGQGKGGRDKGQPTAEGRFGTDSVGDSVRGTRGIGTPLVGAARLRVEAAGRPLVAVTGRIGLVGATSVASLLYTAANSCRLLKHDSGDGIGWRRVT
jgi:hypothetical protein